MVNGLILVGCFIFVVSVLVFVLRWAMWKAAGEAVKRGDDFR